MKSYNNNFYIGRDSDIGMTESRVSARDSVTSGTINKNSSAQFACEYCERSFGTKTGLGVHKSRAHRDEFNSERLIRQRSRMVHTNDVRQRVAISSRRRWTDSEIKALVKLNLEMRLTNPNMSEAALNRELGKKLPGRSVDAIKAQKRGKSYLDNLAIYRTSIQADEPEPNHTEEDTAMTAMNMIVRTLSPMTPRTTEGETEVASHEVSGANVSESGIFKDDTTACPNVSDLGNPVNHIDEQITQPSQSDHVNDCNGIAGDDMCEFDHSRERHNHVDHRILKELKEDALLYANKVKVRPKFSPLQLRHILGCRRDQPATISNLLEQWLKKVINTNSQEGLSDRGKSARVMQKRKIRPGYGSGKGLRGKGRQEEYMYLQNLFKRRGLSTVAKHVLRDSDKVDTTDSPVKPQAPDAEDMFTFWSHIFGNGESVGTTISSETDDDSYANCVWKVITCDDIKRTEMPKNKAMGPDNISVEAWKEVPRSVRALFYNTILYHGVVLSSLTKARTVFIPKVRHPSKPEEYRPITIASVILRQLHRILAKRLTAVMPFEHQQVAFRRGIDGVSANLSTLRTIIEHSKKNGKDLHIVSLDLIKAFDSVDHQAVMQTMSDISCPTVFVDYLKLLYSSAATCLELGNGVSESIRIGRGVFQGDPLSPCIFNYIMDRAIRKLDNDFGYPCGDTNVTCTAFADDVNIVGDSVAGTQLNIDTLMCELAKAGLKANPAKCHSLSIMTDRHRKVAIYDTENRFRINNGDIIKSIGPTTKWKYLGIKLSGEKIDKQLPDIQIKLERIKDAMLKPQQKLEIISKVVMPMLYHQAILGNSSQEELSSTDIQVRTIVRSIMHFPHDVPNNYIHAPVRCGGLGIPELTIRVPICRYKRMKGFVESDRTVARQFERSVCYRHNKEITERFLADNNLDIERDNDLIAKFYLAGLELNCATKGLQEAYHSRQSRSWSGSKSNDISGGDFIKYHLLSSCSIPTLARRAWGRCAKDTKCRQGCDHKETIHHVLQECTLTHGGRVLRHNRALNYIHSFVVKKWSETFNIEKEPHLQTRHGLRKPDLIFYGGSDAIVIDLQVVGRENMRQARCNKVAKYRDLPGLTRLIKKRYGVDNVEYKAITVSYLGIIERSSLEFLRSAGFRCYEVFRLATSVLRGSWLSWFRFKRTHQQRYYERSQTAILG